MSELALIEEATLLSGDSNEVDLVDSQNEDGSSFPCDKDKSTLSLSDLEREERNSLYLVRAFSSYLSKAGVYDLLTEKEEQVLSRRIIEHGDLDARNVLVAHNLRLVVYAARYYSWGKLPFEDLVQEGNVALIAAAGKFDYRYGVRFATFATWWVRQSIRNALRNKGETIRVPIGVQENWHKIQALFGKEEGNKHLSVDAIAERVELSSNDVASALHAGFLKEFSLDSVVFSNDKDGSSCSYQDAVSDDVVVPTEVQVEARSELALACREAEELFAAVRNTSKKKEVGERNVKIFARYHGFSEDPDDVTLARLSLDYGVSVERVRQIIATIFPLLHEKGITISPEEVFRLREKIRDLECLAQEHVVFQW